MHIVYIILCRAKRVKYFMQDATKQLKQTKTTPQKGGRRSSLPPFLSPLVVFLFVQINCVIYHSILNPGSYLLTFFCPVC